MYRTFLELDGTLDTVETLNKAIEAETDIPDFFDPDDDGWRAWAEYREGETIILEETA